ncbi:MAG TPA: hypothetical protein VGF99_03565 [Myxococcota bacterium]
MRSGFTQRAKLDLPPLLDVVSHSSARCTHLEYRKQYAVIYAPPLDN